MERHSQLTLTAHRKFASYFLFDGALLARPSTAARLTFSYLGNHIREYRTAKLRGGKTGLGLPVLI